jgi:hypothetical protein
MMKTEKSERNDAIVARYKAWVADDALPPKTVTRLCEELAAEFQLSRARIIEIIKRRLFREQQQQQPSPDPQTIAGSGLETRVINALERLNIPASSTREDVLPHLQVIRDLSRPGAFESHGRYLRNFGAKSLASLERWLGVEPSAKPKLQRGISTNDVMKTCETCQWWTEDDTAIDVTTGQSVDGESLISGWEGHRYGECEMAHVENDRSVHPESLMRAMGDCGPAAGYLITKYSFGCVHWQRRFEG